MKITTLKELVDDIDNYDEFRPVYIDASGPVRLSSKCLVVLHNAPEYCDWDYVPKEAAGMKRFLSTGQIMDNEATLQIMNENYSASDLEAVLAQAFAELS